MTITEHENLQRGDIVISQFNSQSYVITATDKINGHTAVRTANVSNPQEWDKFTKNHT